MKPKRNETCHCGSGKKYKVCHGTTKEATNNVVYFIAGLAIAVFIFLFFGSSDSGSESLPVSQSPILPYTSRSSPKPPGDAPPGKVWSEEHGHWHDAPQQISGPVETRPRRIETPPKLVTISRRPLSFISTTLLQTTLLKSMFSSLPQ